MLLRYFERYIARYIRECRLPFRSPVTPPEYALQALFFVERPSGTARFKLARREGRAGNRSPRQKPVWTGATMVFGGTEARPSCFRYVDGAVNRVAVAVLLSEDVSWQAMCWTLNDASSVVCTRSCQRRLVPGQRLETCDEQSSAGLPPTVW